MSNRYAGIWLAVLGLAAAGAMADEGEFPVEDRFLSIPLEQLDVVVEEEGGLDLLYRPEGIFDRLADYDKLMIDQPEIWIDEDSEYRGVKPDNIKAIADLLREALIDRTQARGYEIVEQPGPGVLYMRVAVTDLYLKKEKRGVLGYTPIGAAVKLGADAVRDMMSKIDVIEMALQVELLDSESGEVLAAIVIKRGARKDKQAGQKETRMEFGELAEVAREYGARLACSLDNARLPAGQEMLTCSDGNVLRREGYMIEPDDR